MSRASENRRLARKPSSSVSIALFVVIAALSAACGTRVEERGRADGPGDRGLVGIAAPSPTASAPTDTDQAPPPGGMRVDPKAQRTGGRPASSDEQTPSNIPDNRKPVTKNPAVAGQPTTPGSADGGSLSAGNKPAADGPGVGGSTGRVTAGVRSPVITASVGTLSGPVGTVWRPVVQGAQLWVAEANRRGGLSGHEIRLLVYDDGGDSARHRAQVKEAVEQRGVVASSPTCAR